MATFVLVHGAMHGAWCWHKVAARLLAQGHAVVAPDLLGHGIDPTPRLAVTMDAMVDDLCQRLDAVAEPVVLVGHSLGGAVISNLAERRPEKVAKLVYVTAFLLASGESTATALAADAFSPHVRVSTDGVWIDVEPSGLKALFYAGCSDDDVALARALLVPEQVAVSAAPVSVSAHRWGRIPRFYVECTRDAALPIAVQRRMQAAWPCVAVYAVDTDHSPFLSTPDRLAAILQTVAETPPGQGPRRLAG
jgi:pimeloyl-ACP methyl ester carboxylesterase